MSMSLVKAWGATAIVVIMAVAIFTRLAQSKEIPKTIRAATDAVSNLFKGALR